MTSKTLASIDPAIENRRIFWTCGKQGGMKHLLQLPISHCNFFSMLAEKLIRRISKQDVFPKRSADNVTG